MGRKRKSTKISKAYSSAIYGMLLIVLGIAGAMGLGPVGRFLTSVSAFLFGEIYILPLLLLIVLGIYIMYMKEYPSVFKPRMIGLVFVLLGVVMLLHKNNAMQVETPEQLLNMSYTKATNAFKILDGATKEVAFQGIGGGIIGGLFMWIAMALFDLEGAKIMYWVFKKKEYYIVFILFIINLQKNWLLFFRQDF